MTETKTETDEIRDYWDKDAPKWNDEERHFTSAANDDGVELISLHHIRSAIQPYLADLENSRGCDIGSGGLPSIYLPPEVLENSIAVDISEEMLRNNNTNLKTAANLTVGLPFRDASLGWATAFFANRYVPDQEVFLKEVLRVLRPGARMLFVDFNRTGHKLEKSAFEPGSFPNIHSQLDNLVLKQVEIGAADGSHSVWMITGKKK